MRDEVGPTTGRRAWPQWAIDRWRENERSGERQIGQRLGRSQLEVTSQLARG